MRPIDSEAAYQFLTDQLVKETGAFSKGVNKGLNIARSAMRNPDAIPTITPQNEQLTCEGCYWDSVGRPFGKCGVCVREKTDNCRRPPERQGGDADHA